MAGSIIPIINQLPVAFCALGDAAVHPHMRQTKTPTPQGSSSTAQHWALFSMNQQRCCLPLSSGLLDLLCEYTVHVLLQQLTVGLLQHRWPIYLAAATHHAVSFQ